MVKLLIKYAAFSLFWVFVLSAFFIVLYAACKIADDVEGKRKK